MFPQLRERESEQLALALGIYHLRLLSASLGTLRAIQNFCRIRMGEYHVRIALQSIEVMASESLTLLRRDNQFLCSLDQSLRLGVRRRLFGILRFIHRCDELRERLQPPKPGIIN